MKPRFLTFILLLFVALSTIAVAAEKQGSKYAIVIGVNKYLDKAGISTLKYAVSDATAIHQSLIDPAIGGFPEENCVLMTEESGNPRRQPTRSNILATFKTWLSLPTSAEDTVFVSFSGHGIESEGQSYIMPIDAMMSVPEETAIELAKIKDWLRECPAKKKILVLDCCHSGAGKGLKGMGMATMETIKKPDGMITLASCDISERSYEWPEKNHGVFTHFFLEGLHGLADSNKDGAIWADELNLYVWDKTRRWAAEQGLQQTPVYVAAVSGYIELAKLGGSTAPQATAMKTAVPVQNNSKELAAARKFIESGLYDEAAGVIKALHRNTEPTAESYTLLGMAYSAKKGWYELAARQFEQALKLDATSVDAMVLLACLHITEQGRLDEAKSLLQKALILRPDDAKIKDLLDRFN